MSGFFFGLLFSFGFMIMKTKTTCCWEMGANPLGLEKRGSDSQRVGYRGQETRRGKKAS